MSRTPEESRVRSLYFHLNTWLQLLVMKMNGWGFFFGLSIDNSQKLHIHIQTNKFLLSV